MSEKLKVILGVDPGKGGAATILALEGQVIQVVDFVSYAVTIRDVQTLLRPYDLVLTAIEQVGAAPDQGGKSIFNFGANFGFWCGLAYTLNAPVIFPYPQTWQAKRIPKKTTTCKKPSLPLARVEFPYVQLDLELHADRADSIYIADWARLQWLNNNKKVLNECQINAHMDFKPVRFKKRFGIVPEKAEIDNWL